MPLTKPTHCDKTLYQSEAFEAAWKFIKLRQHRNYILGREQVKSIFVGEKGGESFVVERKFDVQLTRHCCVLNRKVCRKKHKHNDRSCFESLHIFNINVSNIQFDLIQCKQLCRAKNEDNSVWLRWTKPEINLCKVSFIFNYLDNCSKLHQFLSSQTWKLFIEITFVGRRLMRVSKWKWTLWMNELMGCAKRISLVLGCQSFVSA
jgi:hypothetical protein